jgi:hypothetical protein
MRKTLPILTAVALVLPGAVVLAGEEKVIDLDAVPTEIMDIAREEAVLLGGLNVLGDTLILDDLLSETAAEDEDMPETTVTFVSANTETETDGYMVYEIQGTFEDGRKVEFDIEPEGRIDEVEIEFSPDMLPGAVTKAIEAKLPGFTPTFIEASHSASLKVIRYELVGTLNGATMDIEVSPDGRHIEVSDQ